MDITALTALELTLINRIAVRDGVSLEQAASRLVSEALARRVKRRTGHTPAKVYSIGRQR